MVRDQIHLCSLRWRKTISIWECSGVAARNQRTMRPLKSSNNCFGSSRASKTQHNVTHNCYSLPSSRPLALKPSKKPLLFCEGRDNFRKKSPKWRKKLMESEGLYPKIWRWTDTTYPVLWKRKWGPEMGCLAQDHVATQQRLKSGVIYSFLVQNYFFYYIMTVIMIWMGKRTRVGFWRWGL